MPRYLTQQEAYLKCEQEGRFIPLEEVDVEKITSIVTISEADVESADVLRKNLPKESHRWSSIYKLYYDALHELAESFYGLRKLK